jgi:predicted ester cyclase
LMGIAPTEMQIELKGITIYRIEADKKIAEEWERYDNLGLMQQLGVAPNGPGQGGSK